MEPHNHFTGETFIEFRCEFIGGNSIKSSCDTNETISRNATVVTVEEFQGIPLTSLKEYSRNPSVISLKKFP